MAMKIYGVFGNQALQRVKEIPMLTKGIRNRFQNGGRLAMKMGIDMSSDSRVTAGIRYVLSQGAVAGHTYLPEDLLIEKTSELLGVYKDQVEHLLAGLVVDKHVVIEQTDDGRNIYLAAFYTAEKNAAIKLLRLAEVEYHYGDASLDERINRLEIKNNIKLDETQREAVKLAVSNGVLVITGGPGTGKTTIINTMIGFAEGR